MEPLVTPPQRLILSESVPDGGVTLDPPSDSQQPSISPAEVLELADKHALFAEDGTKIDRTLVAFTNEDRRPATESEDAQRISLGKPTYQDVLAWRVSYSPVCIPVFGPYDPTRAGDGQEAECASGELNVIIDAMTGTYIESYSYR